MTDQNKINEHDSISQLLILKDICKQIYIIRNVLKLGHYHLLEDEMKRIDDLFKPIEKAD